MSQPPVLAFPHARHTPLACSSTPPHTQVINALAAELATARVGGEGGGEGSGEVVDAVSLETVRDTLEAALDEEIRVAEGDEVRRLRSIFRFAVRTCTVATVIGIVTIVWVLTWIPK